MFCTNCGNKLDNNVNFCTNCGHKVGNGENIVPKQVESVHINEVNTSLNSMEQSNEINKKKNNKSIFIIIMFLIILVIVVFVLTNIFFVKDNVNNLENDIQNNIDNPSSVKRYNNYNVEINMEMVISGVSTEMKSVGVVDELNQKEYLDVTTTSLGFVSLSYKIYHDYLTGYSYMTQPYGGNVWWKEKSMPQTVDLGLILDKLENKDNVEKKSDDCYRVKMTKSDIKGLMSSGNVDDSSLIGDVYVDVYVENNYVVKLEYDFTNAFAMFDSFTIIIKFSDYDNAGDVVIPQNIIENAKER